MTRLWIVIAAVLVSLSSTPEISADITAGGGGSSSSGGSGSTINLQAPAAATDLGAQTTPYRFEYLYGSGTFGTSSFRLGGTPTAHRLITFPDFSGELISGAASNQALNGAAMNFVSGGGMRFNTGYRALFGNGNDAAISVYDPQTPDALMIGVPALSNSLLITESADMGFDFGHAARLYPLVFIHSQSQSQTKYLGIGHNDTDGLIETGAGGLRVNAAQCSGASALCIGGNTTAASTQAFSQTVAIGDLARAHNSAAIALGYGALVSNSSGIAIGSLSNVAGDGAIAIGTSAAAVAGQLVMGRPDALWITEAYLGGTGPVGGGQPSPVAYALKGSPGKGTDIKGATLYLDGGIGSGAAASAPAVLRSGKLGTASGTTAQTIVPHLAAGVAKILVNNTATTIASAVVASDSSAVVMLDCMAESIDAAHVVQHDAGTITCSVTNSNGTLANNACSTPSNVRNVATSGTLTTTWTITAANPALIQANVNSSLTPSTGYPRITCNVANLSQQDVSFP